MRYQTTLSIGIGFLSAVMCASAAQRATHTFDRAAAVEDVNGNQWHLHGVGFKECYETGARGFDRFESQKTDNLAARGKRLVLRVGLVDVLIRLDSLISLQRSAGRTVVAVYDWMGTLVSVEGVIDERDESSYCKHELIGTTDEEAVAVPLVTLKRLVFDNTLHSRDGGPPLQFSSTIELRNSEVVQVARLRRVFESSIYCYHDSNFEYGKGTSNLEVGLDRLSGIEFPAVPDTVKLTFRDGRSEFGNLKNDELFDHSLVGFSGFSDIGEIFTAIKDVKAVRFKREAPTLKTALRP